MRHDSHISATTIWSVFNALLRLQVKLGAASADGDAAALEVPELTVNLAKMEHSMAAL